MSRNDCYIVKSNGIEDLMIGTHDLILYEMIVIGFDDYFGFGILIDEFMIKV